MTRVYKVSTSQGGATEIRLSAVCLVLMCAMISAVLARMGCVQAQGVAGITTLCNALTWCFMSFEVCACTIYGTLRQIQTQLTYAGRREVE